MACFEKKINVNYVEYRLVCIKENNWDLIGEEYIQETVKDTSGPNIARAIYDQNQLKLWFFADDGIHICINSITYNSPKDQLLINKYLNYINANLCKE